MQRIGSWWARQRWGPLAATNEYRRDRAVGLVEGREVERPTEEEWQLAESYLLWLRRQWRGSLVWMPLCVLVVLAVWATARSFVWNLALIVVLTACLQGWRLIRWQNRLNRLRPARDNVGRT